MSITIGGGLGVQISGGLVVGPSVGVRLAGGGGVPSDLAGLQLWVQADAISGLSDDDPVATWSDLSGNGRDLTAADAARPTYKTNIWADKPVVRFDGTGNFMATATTPALAQPNTVFVVAKFDTPKVAQTLLDSTTSTQQLLDIAANTNRRHRMFAGSVMETTTHLATEAWRIFDAQYNGASSTLYVDGLLAKSGNSGSTGFAGIKIGARGTSSLYLDGDVAEVIVYNAALTLAERAQVTSYLRGRWGLTLGRVIFEGDSLTDDATSTYPAACITLLPGKTGVNLGIGGQVTTSLLTNETWWPYGGLALDDVSVIWIGINDLLGTEHSAETLYGYISTLVSQRITSAFSKVIVCTLPDCQWTGQPVSLPSRRLALNTLIRDGAAAGGYVVADLAADARLQNALDTTYFTADKLHLNSGGYGVVAEIVAAVI